MPLIEIPASEMWLYKNKEALQSVQKGLEDAAEGKISKLDMVSFHFPNASSKRVRPLL
jgi:geranylgeranyl pyrophosphate synthase